MKRLSMILMLAVMLAMPIVAHAQAIEESVATDPSDFVIPPQFTDAEIDAMINSLKEGFEKEKDFDPTAVSANGRPIRSPAAAAIGAFKVHTYGIEKSREMTDAQVAKIVGALEGFKKDYPAHAEELDKKSFQFANLSIGRMAPEVEAVDTDEVMFKLSDYRGKVVVIDFWGDW